MSENIVRYLAVSILCSVVLIFAACGDDATDDADLASEPEPTPTEEIAETSTPEPEETAIPQQAATPEPDPTATPEPASGSDDADPEPTPTPVEDPAPAEDIDFAPELAGLTDWRNIEPTSLEDLRGEPVILVFWNSL